MGPQCSRQAVCSEAGLQGFTSGPTVVTNGKCAVSQFTVPVSLFLIPFLFRGITLRIKPPTTPQHRLRFLVESPPRQQTHRGEKNFRPPPGLSSPW